MLVETQLLPESYAADDNTAWGRLAACRPGCVVVECEGADGQPFALTGFKAPSGSIRPMVSGYNI